MHLAILRGRPKPNSSWFDEPLEYYERLAVIGDDLMPHTQVCGYDFIDGSGVSRETFRVIAEEETLREWHARLEADCDLEPIEPIEYTPPRVWTTWIGRNDHEQIITRRGS